MTTIEQPEIDFTAGLVERELAFRRLDESDRDWENRVITTAIKHVAAQGKPFTSDDIRPYLPEVNTQRIGRCFAALNKSGYLTVAGLYASKVKRAHGRKVLIWRLNDDPA